ncbi:MAG: divalent-cation tolerance protein CutA [Candidatus Calescibacterium sp.]|nr:divalent-cation tolerance protein CutA [Candidatus Calescibacterium sp.]MCX7971648.1 divalent-cation tolerance protein CutA [bacterium]MDW8195856.1 divalent-cation tolerance protein CutA [Candidatus Calescibacterium sp.]
MQNVDKSSYRVVYITCPNINDAENIARILVNNRIAACVNILPNVRSVYTWRDKVEEAEEVILIIKTVEDNLELLEETVKKYHPYTVPEIISWPIKSGNIEYLKWMNEVTNVSV